MGPEATMAGALGVIGGFVFGMLVGIMLESGGSPKWVVAPFRLALHACKWISDVVYRTECRNKRYKKRIQRVRRLASERKERKRKAERLAEEYEKLQQEMVDACYENPHEWNELEGKR